MRFLNCSFDQPAHNLALDEVLLNHAETGITGECLRLWESPKRFVVLGVTQPVHQEVFEDHCAEDQIPVLRRCSAGGCVLQGPGCLNYTLVLSMAERPQIRNLHDSYHHILGKLCHAFQSFSIPLIHSGISDLSINGQKVSGSAQKRRLHYILHHGTLLYDIVPNLMTRYLKEPSDRPSYRGIRTHEHFVGTIPLERETIHAVVCAAFDITSGSDTLAPLEMEAMEKLVDEKYTSDTWNRRR